MFLLPEKLQLRVAVKVSEYAAGLKPRPNKRVECGRGKKQSLLYGPPRVFLRFS